MANGKKYDYEKGIKEKYLKNLQEVKNSTKKEWLKIKIKNFAEKFNFKEKKSQEP